MNGQPTRTDPAVRQLERDAGALTAIDPYQGGASVPLTQRLADPVEEATLHMVNSDPKRTPTFTLFGNADFFFQGSNSDTCGTPTQTTCVDPKFAWNHGDFQDEIANTWVGIVGPGVANNGIDSTTWTDHTDYRPTINALVGLVGQLRERRPCDHARSSAANGRRGPNKTLTRSSAAIYKQINAPFGKFGARHAQRVDDRAQVDRRAEVRLDRDGDRQPDVAAQHARELDSRGAERRRGGERPDRRGQREALDREGPDPAREGPRARGGFVADRSRSTSGGSSSRHWPGSSPSSVSGP